jgi:hypothetical protein
VVSALIVVFSFVTLFIIVGWYHCFGGMCCLHLQGWSEYSEDAVRLYRQVCKVHGHTGPWGQKRRWDLVSVNRNDEDKLKKPDLISDLKHSLPTFLQNCPEKSHWAIFLLPSDDITVLLCDKAHFHLLTLPVPIPIGLVLVLYCFPHSWPWLSTFAACLYNLTVPRHTLEVRRSVILWISWCSLAILNMWQSSRLLRLYVHKSCDLGSSCVSIPCVLGNWGWSVHFSTVSKPVCMLSPTEDTMLLCILHH